MNAELKTNYFAKAGGKFNVNATLMTKDYSKKT